MAKSIITDDMNQCLLCGRPYPQWHHCMYGVANRKLSDQYGLIVPLCVDHHVGKNGVHQCRAVDLGIKQLAQSKFEEQYSREEWMELFGRNYL